MSRSFSLGVFERGGLKWTLEMVNFLKGKDTPRVLNDLDGRTILEWKE